MYICIPIHTNGHCAAMASLAFSPPETPNMRQAKEGSLTSERDYRKGPVSNPLMKNYIAEVKKTLPARVKVHETRGRGQGGCSRRHAIAGWQHTRAKALRCLRAIRGSDPVRRHKVRISYQPDGR